MDAGIKTGCSGVGLMRWMLAALVVPCWAVAQSPTPEQRPSIAEVIKKLPPTDQTLVAYPSLSFSDPDCMAKFQQVAGYMVERMLSSGYTVAEAKEWKDAFLEDVAKQRRDAGGAVAVMYPSSTEEHFNTSSLGESSSFHNLQVTMQGASEEDNDAVKLRNGAAESGPTLDESVKKPAEGGNPSPSPTPQQ